MFRRNVAALTLGTVVGQCILLAATPILTRYFGPEAFGALATYSALYGLLSGAGTLRYDLAIPSFLKVDRAYAIGAAAMASAVVVAFLVTLLLVFSGLIAAWHPPSWAWLLPPGMAFVAVYGVAQQWAARERTYQRYAVSLVAGPTINVSCAVLLGHQGFLSGWSLVFSFFLGLIAATTVMITPGMIGRRVWKSIASVRPVKRLHLLTLRMREYPQYVLPTYLAAAAANALPVLLLGAMYSQEDVGYYAVAMRFLLSPSALIGGAISEALRSEMFQMRRDNRTLFPIVRKVLGMGLSIGLPLLLLVWVVGGDFLVFIVGSNFIPSGQLVPYLAVGAIASVVIQPLQSVFLVCGRQKIGLVAQAFLTLVPSAVMCMVALQGNQLSDALLGYALALVVVAIAYASLALRITRNSGAIPQSAGRRK